MELISFYFRKEHHFRSSFCRWKTRSLRDMRTFLGREKSLASDYPRRVRAGVVDQRRASGWSDGRTDGQGVGRGAWAWGRLARRTGGPRRRRRRPPRHFLLPRRHLFRAPKNGERAKTNDRSVEEVSEINHFFARWQMTHSQYSTCQQIAMFGLGMNEWIHKSTYANSVAWFASAGHQGSCAGVPHIRRARAVLPGWSS